MSDPRKAPLTETATPVEDTSTMTDVAGAVDGSSPNGHAHPATMSTEAEHVATPAPAAEAAAEPIIRLEDVSFYYGAFRAVKDVSIAFTPKRITALI